MLDKMFKISQVTETKNKQNAGIWEILARYLPEDSLQNCSLGPASASSERLGPASVPSERLGPASLPSESLGPDSVTSDRLEPASVRSGDLGPVSIKSDGLELASVRSDSLGPSSVTSERHGPASVRSDIPEEAFVRTNEGTNTLEASMNTGLCNFTVYLFSTVLEFVRYKVYDIQEKYYPMLYKRKKETVRDSVGSILAYRL
jgi:hypothetical protein